VYWMRYEKETPSAAIHQIGLDEWKSPLTRRQGGAEQHGRIERFQQNILSECACLGRRFGARCSEREVPWGSSVSIRRCSRLLLQDFPSYRL